MFCDGGIVEFWENQRFWGLTWGVPLLPFDWPAFSDAQGNAVQLARPLEREGERGWFIVRTLGTDEEGWRYSTVFSKLTTPRPGGRSSKRSSDYVRSRIWRKLAVDPPAAPERELQALSLDVWTSSKAGAPSGAVSTSQLALSGTSGGGLPPDATSGAAGGPSKPRLPPEAERILCSAVAAADVAGRGGAGGSAAAAGALPKPSLFKLWQLFMELWNDACARHGMRRLVPLDPLGLYVAARRHRELIARQRLAQLAAGRLVAAAPMATEVEPDILDGQQEAQQQSAAAAGRFQQAEVAGQGSAQAAQAAMAAAAATAAATAAQHRSPTVGETPTGAAIMQPAAPQPVVLHRHGSHRHGSVVFDPEFRTASITGPPGRHAASSTAGAMAAAAAAAAAGVDGDGDTLLSADQGLMPDLSDPTTLLAELITATNYSRAAYGYVMAAGHLDSLTKLFTMLSSSAHFNPITGASAEANLEAIHLFTGIPVEDVVMAEWRSSVFRPCHYLAVDRKRRRLVLAVRGSLELADIATDLTARPVEYDFGGGLVGHVHQGLMSAASYVQLNTAAALRSAAERFPGWPLLVTGHSLGAGVAALLTLLLLQRSRPMGAPPAVPVVHCLAIAPPAVLSVSLAEAARECVVSVVNQGDFVARLSCYSVDRALLELVQASPAAQMADNLLQSTGATWAAIQQRLAALGGAAAGAGAGWAGAGGWGAGGWGGGGWGAGGWGGGGGARAGEQSAPNLREMEVEMVATGPCGRPAAPAAAAAAAAPSSMGPVSAGLKDIPFLTGASPSPRGLLLSPSGRSRRRSNSPPRGHGHIHSHALHAHQHAHQHAHHLRRHSHLRSQQPHQEHARRTDGGVASDDDDDDDDDDGYSVVSARSSDGSETGLSYYTAMSPRESYIIASSSPASHVRLSFDDAVDAGFLYRSMHLSEHSHSHPRHCLPPAGSQQPSQIGSHPLSGMSSVSAAVGQRTVAAAAADLRMASSAAGIAAAAAAAAAAVGGVPYASHPRTRSILQGTAGSASAARPIPGALRPQGEDAAAVDDRFAAMTPLGTSPAAESAAGLTPRADGWSLVQLGAGGGGGGGMPAAGEAGAAEVAAVAAVAALEALPLGARQGGDPLSSRGLLYRHVMESTEESYDDGTAGERPGAASRWLSGAAAGAALAAADGGRRRRRRPPRERTDLGAGGDVNAVGADGLVSWESLSQKLMTSWFGQGFFDEEDEEEEAEELAAARAASVAAARAASVAAGGGPSGADDGGGVGRGSGSFKRWCVEAMLGPMAAEAAGEDRPPAAAAVGPSMTSFWPGLEEPPGPLCNLDKSISGLRGKYGAPTQPSRAASGWPWSSEESQSQSLTRSHPPPASPSAIPSGESRSQATAGLGAAADAEAGATTSGASAAGAASAAEATTAAAAPEAGTAGQATASDAGAGAAAATPAATAPAAVTAQAEAGAAASAESTPAESTTAESTTADESGAGAGAGAADGGGGRRRYLHSASTPCQDVLDALTATNAADGGDMCAPHQLRALSHMVRPRASGSGAESAAAAAATATAATAAAAAAAATAAAAAAAVASDAAVPHYIHSAHKELYPPGRLMWIIVEDRDALPPELRRRVMAPRGGAKGASGAAAAAKGPVAANAAATAVKQTATGAAPAALAQGAGASGGSGSGGGGDSRCLAKQEAAPAAAGVAEGVARRSQPGSSSDQAAIQSYNLLDLSLVSDLVQGMAAPPPAGGSVLSGGGAAAAAPPPCPVEAPAPMCATRAGGTAAVEGGAAALAEVQGCPPSLSPSPPSGGKRHCISAPDTDCGSGSPAAAAPAESPTRALESAVEGQEGVLTACIDGRMAVAVAAAGGGDPMAACAATPFSVRVREGLKRFKTGVESMLRQTPLPAVPSVSFLPAMGSAEDEGLGIAGREGSRGSSGSGTSERGGAQAGAGAGPGAEDVRGQQWVFLVEADREVFERMVLIPSCIPDHLPDAYMQRLRQLARGNAATMAAGAGPRQGPGAGPTKRQR